MATRFANRQEAGRQLGQALLARPYHEDVVVLALPRGGVPVGFEVAQALQAPLDVFLVRKLGVPGHEELALGAIASGGVRVLNDNIVRLIGISPEEIDRITQREQQELERRERAYRDGRPPLEGRGKTAILVDDGLATGSTMRAAVTALKRHHPARIVIAVPTAAEQTCEELGPEVDDLICLMTPEPFNAVGLWYEDFAQVTDEEVRDLLERAAPQSRRVTG